MNSREISRTNDSSVVDEFSNEELGFGVIPARWKVLQIRLANWVDEQMARDRDSPADHESLRVENGPERGARLTDPAAELVQRVNCPGVSGCNELADDRTGEAVVRRARLSEGKANAFNVGDFVRETEERSTRSILLDATASPAPARQSVGDDPEVSEFGASAKASAEESSARNYRATDSSADRQHRHICRATPGPEPIFGPPGGVRIVVNRDVEVDSFRNSLAEGLVAPIDVGGVIDDRLLGVDKTGRRNSRSNDLVPGRQALNHRHDNVDDGGRISGRSRLPILRDDVAFFAYERASDLRSANVNSDRMHE